MALPHDRCEPRFAYRYQARKPARLIMPRRARLVQHGGQRAKRAPAVAIGLKRSACSVSLGVRPPQCRRFLMAEPRQPGWPAALGPRSGGGRAGKRSVRIDGNRCFILRLPAQRAQGGQGGPRARIACGPTLGPASDAPGLAPAAEDLHHEVTAASDARRNARSEPLSCMLTSPWDDPLYSRTEGQGRDSASSEASFGRSRQINGRSGCAGGVLPNVRFCRKLADKR